VGLLRQRATRSVHLERDAHGAAVIVKRFHHAGALGALFDGARARREHAALLRLHAAGLPVPRPLGVARAGAVWELRQEALEGARPLGEFLDGRATPPRGWRALARLLGELLARLHRLDVEHGDLHPGNVLVDPEGRPWLVDLGRARTRRADAAHRADELALATALARETLDVRTRLAFLASYAAALPPALRPALEPAARRALEQAGRARRRALVELGLNRWLRASSRVEREPDGSLVRRELGALAPERALALEGEPAALRRAWLEAARLHEHRLPTALPARLAPRRALFELPARGAPDVARYQALRADRGLAPDPRPAQDARGVWFAPTA